MFIGYFCKERKLNMVEQEKVLGFNNTRLSSTKELIH
jgi:hypothetical protein